MSRTAVGIDRAVALLLGLALIAVAVLGWAWHLGKLGTVRALQTSPATEATHTWWWPWATGVFGVLALGIAIRWLIAHRPARRASRVVLEQSSEAITVDATSVADACAAALEANTSVLKARGSATMQRGVPTVTLTATVPARQGLRYGVAAADDAMRSAGAMLGDAVAIRTVLHTDPKHHHGPVL